MSTSCPWPPSSSCNSLPTVSFPPSSSSFSTLYSLHPGLVPSGILSPHDSIFMSSGYSTPSLHSPAFLPLFMETEAERKERREERTKGGGKAQSRRYKTPSPQVLRMRRCAANERERKRMTTLNDAFDTLRCKLQERDAGRRLSKYETLQMAQSYIAQLAEVLQKLPPAPQTKSDKREPYR